MIPSGIYRLEPSNIRLLPHRNTRCIREGSKVIPSGARILGSTTTHLAVSPRHDVFLDPATLEPIQSLSAIACSDGQETVLAVGYVSAVTTPTTIVWHDAQGIRAYHHGKIIQLQSTLPPQTTLDGAQNTELGPDVVYYISYPEGNSRIRLAYYGQQLLGQAKRPIIIATQVRSYYSAAITAGLKGTLSDVLQRYLVEAIGEDSPIPGSVKQKRITVGA